MNDHLDFHQYFGYIAPKDTSAMEQSTKFRDSTITRRSIRHFSDRSVPQSVIDNCLLAAGSAPSGANQQPWHFAIVRSQEIKREIRIAAEAEEQEFYQRRAPDSWLDSLRPLGTNAKKPFLEIASHLIVIFTQTQTVQDDGKVQKHYYATESVGIATGILINALHHSGLVTLTHTPSPMSFLNKILQRPKHERPFLLLVVGYPAEDATVPNISKKNLNEISSRH